MVRRGKTYTPCSEEEQEREGQEQEQEQEKREEQGTKEDLELGYGGARVLGSKGGSTLYCSSSTSIPGLDIK